MFVQFDTFLVQILTQNTSESLKMFLNTFGQKTCSGDRFVFFCFCLDGTCGFVVFCDILTTEECDYKNEKK